MHVLWDQKDWKLHSVPWTYMVETPETCHLTSTGTLWCSPTQANSVNKINIIFRKWGKCVFQSTKYIARNGVEILVLKAPKCLLVLQVAVCAGLSWLPLTSWKQSVLNGGTEIAILSSEWFFQDSWLRATALSTEACWTQGTVSLTNSRCPVPTYSTKWGHCVIRDDGSRSR